MEGRRGRLVVTRRELQEIVIGAGESRVVVRVVSIRGAQVRIAIEAPEAERILRAELIGRERVGAQKGTGNEH